MNNVDAICGKWENADSAFGSPLTRTYQRTTSYGAHQRWTRLATIPTGNSTATGRFHSFERILRVPTAVHNHAPQIAEITTGADCRENVINTRRIEQATASRAANAGHPTAPSSRSRRRRPLSGTRCTGR